MARVVMYSTQHCPFCTQARALLDRKGVVYEEVDVSRDEAQREHMMRASGRRTVPQIFIDGRPVGGYDDLLALERSGELDRLLAA